MPDTEQMGLDQIALVPQFRPASIPQVVQLVQERVRKTDTIAESK